ncbi:CLP1-P domain-containing protein [Aphelenchoides besseyi]|nr:CLP1-P domain-containing protein [Aphelenchoides besseyi]KAI6208375.1 CLP1-P domain-containing protein [Aphelenchoides besseyi]
MDEEEFVQVMLDTGRSVIQCVKPEYHLLFVPPDGIHLAGAFRFQCLYGAVTVAGFTQESTEFDENRFVSLGVHNKSQIPLHFVPTNADSISSNQPLFYNRIEKILEYNERDLNHVMNFSAVLLIDASLNTAIQYLLQRFGNFTKPLEKFKWLHVGGNCYVVKGIKLENRIETIPPYLPNDEIIHNAMDYACTLNNIIMITGCKGAGKSTMNRYMSNRYHSQGKTVYFLDTDIGQTEFTPPGCVSLVRIDKPILTPTFLHQLCTFKSTICLGTISPGNYVQLYVDSVLRLFKKYTEISDENSVLVVNSHGWVEGVGLEIMQELLEGICPSTVINLKVDQAKSSFEISQISTTQHFYDYTVLPRINEQTSREINARMARDLAIAGYFANCLNDRRFGVPTPERTLANVFAYQVSFDNIQLFFNRDRQPVKDNFIFSALNCSIVALCSYESDDEKSKLKVRNMCNDSTLPRILACSDERKSMAFACFGFGLIRAISPEKRVFYLITPMATEMCSKIQLFVVPHGLYTPQYLFDRDDSRPSPYVAQTRTPEEYNQMVRDQNRVITALQTRLQNNTQYRKQRVIANNNQAKRLNQNGQHFEPPTKKSNNSNSL